MLTALRARFSFLACLLTLLLPGLAAWAQAPEWQGVLTPYQVGSGSTTVNASVTDASGNVYMAGTFTGTIFIGSTTLSSVGGEDIFVAKWNPATGFWLWAQRAGSSGNDNPAAVAISGSSVYVAGSFTGSTFDFGPARLSGAGASEGFVAKLTDAGNAATFGWARSLGGPDADNVYGLAAVGSSVYLAGDFYSQTATFGSISLTNSSTNPYADGFVAKLSDIGPSADFGWVQPIGGTGDDHTWGLTAAGTSVYAIGGFSNTIRLGSTSLSGGSLSSFVTKLTDAGPSGSFAWALQNTGGIMWANALAVSGANVYVTGRFLGTAVLGSHTLVNNAPGGGYDVFVTKVTDAGSTAAYTWALRAGGGFSDYASGIAVRGRQVYVVGGFGATATFGSTTLSSQSLSDDVFVASLIDAGGTADFAWAQSAGSAASESVRAVATGPGGAVYVAGAVGTPATFGPVPVTGTGTSTGFLATLTDPVLASTTASQVLAFTVYPNPARNTATVRLPALPGNAQASLFVCNALGAVVRSQKVPPAARATVELPLLGLAPGIYYLRLQVGTQHASEMLAIE